MAPIVLRDKPQVEDDMWDFRATIPRIRRQGMGKHISFSPQAITLDVILFPSNRILQSDDLSKFILASFENLRFPDNPPSVGREYMLRLFQAGLFLNGVQYRFYGHSNSQLRSRSCFLREADTDEELDSRIYNYGEFKKIMNVAKRAKRIGLLFSKAELDWNLDPKWTKDIDDIIVNGENFSDGCGLMSKRFAIQLSRHKRFIFHGRPYTPCVFQIRYRGYKGVLALHPELNEEHHVHFRASQKKFNATQINTFSMVDHSVPYAFGRLNNDVIVLLSSLGISDETLLRKQEAYHQWIAAASSDWEVGFNFLSALGQWEWAERLILDGIDSRDVLSKIRSLQMSELAAFKKNEKFRARMVVLKSRLLFGICDPYGVLREGEVHVRVSVPRMGTSTLKNTEVLIVRNPCLHPGDCLKLWAVDHPQLSHLVDCVVFASQGKRAAPSMSSGGDLDGDRFLVVWDPDLVPKKVAESYTYPAAKEHISNQVTRQDLARHFASYNSMTLAKITALHAKWVRCSPKGAMSDECQDLNALHSHAVDGASVKIPEHLRSPPVPESPYIIDLLQDAAKSFFDAFLQSRADGLEAAELDREDAEEILVRLLSTEKLAVSEFEVVTLAAKYAQKHGIDIRQYLSHVDFGALATAEKHALSMHLELSSAREWIPIMWNSLTRSEILHARDLENRSLGGLLRLQRLYSSSVQGRAAFFEYLREATQQYKRRLIILKTDDRFSVGIFLRGTIPWDDEPELNDNVVVCPFMPRASSEASTYWRGTKGYKLHCSENVMQLYNQKRGDTFIFVQRPPEKSGSDVVTSIALQKISTRVQKQCGRVQRTPVIAIEIHVVSNRDRVAHQAFDLRFEHVQSEEYLRRFDYTPHSFTPNTLDGFQWEDDELGRQVFSSPKQEVEHILSDASYQILRKYFKFAVKYHAEDQIFWIFQILMDRDFPLDHIATCIAEYPSLSYSALKHFLPVDSVGPLPHIAAELVCPIIYNIVRSANSFGIASLAALEKLAPDVDQLDLATYFDVLWLSVLSIRAPGLVQEVLLVLHESRVTSRARSELYDYAHKFMLGIAFDRAEEAADACPCDEGGRPKRQRTAPVRAKLFPTKPTQEQVPENAELNSKVIVEARIRVDAQTPARIHSHVRLKVASPQEYPGSGLPPAVVDAVVVRASRGELYLEMKHPLPPEYEQADWNLYHAGSIATSKAMMDAVLRLAQEGSQCCRFDYIIAGRAGVDDHDQESEDGAPGSDDTTEFDSSSISSSLNASQRAAVLSAERDHLALIWGPPGESPFPDSGSTPTTHRDGKNDRGCSNPLALLARGPANQDSHDRIHAQRYAEPRADQKAALLTASHHQAVDNVLERFLAENATARLLTDEQVLRAATESAKVNKSLQRYTVDARVGGSLADNPRLIQKAERRVREARVVFTTCSGAGLGVLRHVDFETVLVDEASQITEPCALVPLVKGCRRAVLVGDQ
ncbi:hypothetical protein AcV5_003869 [Taiwanofungus camphoratus]|nr:hypothetical protein AcV5_003869 [Antrodia cinnamomea]